MNPCVAPHIDFVSEETHGHNLYKTSQSSKWLKELQPDVRVQMVESSKKQHYYIFEPVKLKSSKITVPIFFYTQLSKLFTKCYTPFYKSNKEKSKFQTGIPKNILFDNEELKVIPVKDMELNYGKIQMSNGINLSECCGGKIYGQISHKFSDQIHF
jgi:hypothetical protein